MNFPQMQMFAGAEGATDAPNNPQQEDGSNSMIQNDLMRQMQQQLAGQSGGAPQQQQGGTGLGQFQNINANVLMSAFQNQSPEQLLASVLAAANNNSQQQNGAPSAQQPAPQPASAAASAQQNPFAGLDQLQGLNPTALPQGFPQSFNGLQGLQQQLMSLQQQLGSSSGAGGQAQGQEQPQQNQPEQHDQRNAIFPQQQQQQQNQPQQQFPWIGQMGQQFNPAAFGPTTIQFGAMSGGTDHNGFQDPYQNAGMALGGMNGINPATFQFQQHQQQFQHFPQQQQNAMAAQQAQAQARRGSSISGTSAQQAKGLSALLSEEQDASTKKPAKARKVNNVDKKKRTRSFPEKLMSAITDYGNEESVAWLPDGKSFVVVNPDLFCSQVLNKIFKGSKYASFVRKLHRWGFVRLTSGTGTDCFHHQYFQRQKRDLAAKIVSVRNDKEPQPSRSNVKPPSLAGVEKFIRAKVVAAAATAAATAEESLLRKEEDDLSGDD